MTYLTLVNGVPTLAQAIATTAGAGDAGKIPKTNVGGTLDFGFVTGSAGFFQYGTGGAGIRSSIGVLEARNAANNAYASFRCNFLVLGSSAPLIGANGSTIRALNALATDYTDFECKTLLPSDPATTRTNLGLAIGTNVQAYHTDLQAISALSPSDAAFLYRSGGVWTAPDFNEAVDDRVSSLLVAGSNISLTYDDTANTLTIAATGGGGGGIWGSITGTLSDQSDLQSALDGKQPLDSDLTAIAALSPSDGTFIKRSGGAWTAATLATADIGDAIASSAGVGDAGKAIKVDSSGLLDYSFVRGASGLFQIQAGGPQLKNSSGTIQARNSADSDYAPFHVEELFSDSVGKTRVNHGVQYHRAWSAANAILTSAGFPQYGSRAATANTVDLTVDFDAATQEACTFFEPCVRAYSGGSLILTLRGMMASATTGEIVLGAQFRRQRAGNTVSGALGTAIVVVSATVPGSAGTYFDVSMPVTNGEAGAIAIDDSFSFLLFRGAAYVTDTAAGDYQLISAFIREVSAA